MIEGDGLSIARCENCGRLSLIMFEGPEPVACVCPPEDALIKLVAAILEELQEPLGRAN
jgi:hypothetical protein